MTEQTKNVAAAVACGTLALCAIMVTWTACYIAVDVADNRYPAPPAATRPAQ